MTFLKDFYGYIWDNIYLLEMPYRAILVLVSSYFLLWLIFSVLFKSPVKKLDSWVFAIVIEILLRINYALICLCRILTKGWIPDPLKQLDDYFFNVKEKQKNNNVSVSKYFVKLSPVKSTLLLIILICSWISLPYTGMVKDSRIEKYSYLAGKYYSSFEKRITLDLGIVPKPVKVANSQSNSAPIPVKYFSLNQKGAKGAKLKSKPSYNSKTVATVKGSILLQYLERSESDKEKRLWYLVKVPNGKTGWISSKLVKN